jgi:hypothetical protein
MRFVAGKDAQHDRDLTALVPQLYDMEISAVKKLLRELVPEYTPHLD